MSKFAAMVGLLLCWIVTATASSGYLRGVITAVKPADGNVVRFQVRLDFEAHGRFGQKETMELAATAATEVTFNRQPAGAAEAIKVGRTAFVQIHRRAIARVDVLELPVQAILPEPAASDPANGALELIVPVGSGKAVRKVRVCVVIRGGKLHSGFVQNAHAKAPVDLTGLSLAAGKLSGRVQFDMPYVNRSWMPKTRKKTKNPTTFRFTAPVGAEAAVTVTADFWGTGKELAGKVSFRRRRPTPEQGRVVFHITRNNGYFYDVCFAGTKVTSVEQRDHYGRSPKPVTAELTFADGILRGTIGDVRVDLAQVDMEFHGKWSDGKTSGLLTGGFVPPGRPLVTRDVMVKQTEK